MSHQMCKTMIWVVAFCCLQLVTSHPSSPTVAVKNGTLQGLHLPEFQQDLFLGVPFAQPPLGSLRFRHPQPYNHSWSGVRKADRRGKSCVGYAGFAKGLDLGEDCLTLDIVRPASVPSGPVPVPLPVFVWIYGGGFTAGGSADARYNTSYLVNASASIDKPIIAVSINYRLGAWGFLSSEEVQAESSSNAGLFDQRLALRWIKENIQAFGGDPEAITIAGESAGAFSVGYHTVGFDGDHGDLFRGAIFQSGTALGPKVMSMAEVAQTYQPIYDNITHSVGCDKARDSLACLRAASFNDLNKAFSPFVLTPVLDGMFLKRLPSESIAQGLVADVAILAGSNTDEGTATFFGPRGSLNNSADVRSLLSSMVGNNSYATNQLMQLYPDDPAVGCPFDTGVEPFAQWGNQYKRGAAIIGDAVIHAGRRATTQYYATLPAHRRKPVYSYRFDQSPWNNSLPLIATEAPVYATHYAEICFVFNLNPDISRSNTNWIGPYPEYHALASDMSGAWISFVHSLNPNSHGGLPQWPDYSLRGENMVFRAKGSHIEQDDWRTDQLRFWSTIYESLGT